MARMSREKGKRGEREAAAWLSRADFPAWRSSQVRGGETGRPDVECPRLATLGFHLEVKRCETPRVLEWLRQCERDAPGQKALILWRWNAGEWQIIANDAAREALGLEDEPRVIRGEVVLRALWEYDARLLRLARRVDEAEEDDDDGPLILVTLEQ